MFRKLMSREDISIYIIFIYNIDRVFQKSVYRGILDVQFSKILKLWFGEL